MRVCTICVVYMRYMFGIQSEVCVSCMRGVCVCDIYVIYVSHISGVGVVYVCICVTYIWFGQ